MKLQQLEDFERITIQCHDNPDADALASGFGLYTYFKEKGKDVRLIYSGQNVIQKKNLTLMVEKLQIPITYVKNTTRPIKGLLITVDCQYGAGNVTRFEADAVAVIDHHQREVAGLPLSEIHPNIGSCSTLVWQMMMDEGFSFEGRPRLGTALYYGLFSDTNQFSEIFNPLDMDMRDSIPCEVSLINLFKNSNLSLREMEIAGIALIKHMYNAFYRYDIINAMPCDPNILGLISDFLVQVDGVDTCVVYNEQADGIKFSVRSCVKEVRANELADFLAGEVGSGGGRSEKAGGVINRMIYAERLPQVNLEMYFTERMNNYFEGCRIIDVEDCHVDMEGADTYRRLLLPEGYIFPEEVLEVVKEEPPITVRTLEGDMKLPISNESVIMIDVKGDVYFMSREQFFQDYCMEETPYKRWKGISQSVYTPTIRNRDTGEIFILEDIAHACMPRETAHVYAKELTERVKVFTRWEREKYILGNPGDFLTVKCDDPSDVCVVERKLFFKLYEQI